VLFQHRRRYFATLFDEDGQIVMDSIQHDNIMNEIRCRRDEPLAPPSQYPDDDEFDWWLDIAREKWAKDHQVSANEVNIVCSMAILTT
jgi:hypothetical protein